MSLINNILAAFRPEKQLASQPANNQKKERKRTLKHTPKAISRTRQDIKSWNTALATAQSETPKNYALQLLYRETTLDALLTAQIENRKQQVFSVGFVLKNESGETDQEQTDLLIKHPVYRQITNAIQDSIYYGYNLVEFSMIKLQNGEFSLVMDEIPRTNVVPQTGMFYENYTEDKGIKYRELAEFGTWVLEFNSGGLGLINKAVPHVLFKRFAQSCYSELCEIYGIPPRVMKTNTQDEDALKRAEEMMRDMGAAAWFIIDESEEFEWAEGVATNGDVYSNLITICNSELSLLINGAVIGQDTKNGNRSKEEVAQDVLWELVKSDMALLEQYWNTLVIPALVKMGVLKPGLKGEFEQVEDIDQLWNMTKDVLQYMTVDEKWIKETFGIPVTGQRQQPGMLTAGDFFD